MNKEIENKEKNKDAKVSFTSSLVSNEINKNYSDATLEMLNGMEILKDLAETYSNVSSDQTKGRMLEIIESTKRNYNNKLTGINEIYKTTESMGMPHHPADVIKYDKFGNPIEYIQAKSSVSHIRATKELSNEKYHGMTKWTDKDNFEGTKELAQKRSEMLGLGREEYQDTYKNIQKTDTLRSESVQAAENPNYFALKNEAIVISKEAIINGITGATIGGGVSLVQSFINKGLCMENIDDSLKGATKSGAISATSSLIKNIAHKSNINILTKSNIATALATNIIHTGYLTIQYVKGKITFEELMIESGQEGISAFGGLYTGAIAGSLLGPPGAIVGGLIGYTVYSHLYKSTIHIFKNAKLSEEESYKLELLSKQLVEQIEESRKTLEEIANTIIKSHQKIINDSLEIISKNFYNQDTEAFSQSILNLSLSFGKELQFNTFEEFENFMEDPNQNFKL